MIRAFTTGLAASSTAALMPLIARDLLGGNASVFGLLLGASGVGAVIGAFAVATVRERLKAEQAVSLCAAVTGAMILPIGFSHSLLLTCALLMVAGSAYMLLVTLLSVGVQLSTPRWVAARALSWFQSALTGGIALGAWLWGHVTASSGISTALMASGIALLLTPLIGLVFPMPRISRERVEAVEIANEPEVELQITARSGPIVIEIDYRVDAAQARQFYELMLKIQRARLRNGAYEWSISRDIANPELWTERYHCPTWGDYLRQRSRYTQGDEELQIRANEFHRGFDDGAAGLRVRRRLERPFGSVRWRADSPDVADEPIHILPH